MFPLGQKQHCNQWHKSENLWCHAYTYTQSHNGYITSHGRLNYQESRDLRGMPSYGELPVAVTSAEKGGKCVLTQNAIHKCHPYMYSTCTCSHQKRVLNYGHNLCCEKPGVIILAPSSFHFHTTTAGVGNPQLI